MKPIEHEHRNDILKAPPNSDNVNDLPIARIVFENNVNAVESCWEMTDEELEIIKTTKKVYFTCFGVTHPPILITAKSHIK